MSTDITDKEPEAKSDSYWLVCPYCDHEHEIEPCDYDEHLNFTDCEKCGKEFSYYSEISVTHYSFPVANESD